MTDNRMIKNNIPYIINIFSEYGIMLDECKNFSANGIDEAIYLTHNGNSIWIYWDIDKKLYYVKHQNKICNPKEKHAYHPQAKRRNFYSLVSVADFCSTLHRPK